MSHEYVYFFILHFHSSLSSDTISEMFFSFISSSTPYYHVLLCLPLFLLPGKFYLNALFGGFSFPILLRWPYSLLLFNFVYCIKLYLYLFTNYFIIIPFHPRRSIASSPKVHCDSHLEDLTPINLRWRFCYVHRVLSYFLCVYRFCKPAITGFAFIRMNWYCD